MKKVILMLLAMASIGVYAELTPVQVKKLWGLQDENGTMVVAPTYTSIGEFSGQYTWVNKGGKCPYPQFPISGKWGVIDDEGREVCPVIYDYVDLCYGDYVNVNKGGQIDPDSRTITGGLWGVYDLVNQKEVVPCVYTQLGPVTADSTCWAQKEGNGNRKLLTILEKDDKGKVTNVQYCFYFYSDFRFKDFFPRHRDEGKWGIIDINGTELTKFEFTKVNEFIEGYSVVSISRKLGVIDTKGNHIIPCEYKNVTNPRHWGVCWAQKETEYALLDITNKELTPYKYEFVEEFSEGRAWVKDGELYGLVDTVGRELISPRYHKVFLFYNGFSVVMTGNKVGLINAVGAEVVAPQYINSPIQFGDNQFRPYDPLSPHCIQWLQKEDKTYDWINKQGDIIANSEKSTFSVLDVIPNKLWNY